MAALRFFEREFHQHVEDHLCAAGQCRKLVRARCVNACPAGVDTPAYLALIAEGRYDEALAIHRERNPFALVCGRACPAFCEHKCRRAEIDQPVAIRLVKRFMADEELEKPWTPTVLVSGPERERNATMPVAIIGAGPAGLTAGLRLAQRGYPVTVFEKDPTPGGMLTWAIPEYRLPRSVIDAEIENIRRAGVEIRCNAALGRDITIEGLMSDGGYKAVILAIGAHKSRKLGIPGEDKRGVMNGLQFLREVALAPPEQRTVDVNGKRVAVVGGGDVAIDVARCAVRLGASQVHVLYRRAGEHMPAAHLPEEIDAAMQEGVQFHTLVNPTEILGEDRVTGLRVQRQRLSEFDGSGRRKPVGIEQDAYVLHVDLVVPAVGQTPDVSWLDGSTIRTTPSSTLVVGPAQETARTGVFAAGDAVRGPATIVEAVADGNVVAAAVDEWLTTGRLSRPHLGLSRHDLPLTHDLDAYARAHRPQTPRLPVQQRSDNFVEVELGFDEHTAREESRRCLRCDLEWLDACGFERPAVEQEVAS
jgi:NADH-quinone oxidoreductase subunit F